MALVFLGLLVIALVVAAILGLATVMPGWLAALVVGAAFLVILAIAALIGLRWVKKAMPLVPADAIRGLRYDVGIVTEGRSFDPRLLDPSTIQYKRAQATKEAEKARQQLEKEAQDRAHGKVKLPTPTEAELRERLAKRREHLLDVREGLVAEMDVKRQAGYLADDVRSALAGASGRSPFAKGRPRRPAQRGRRAPRRRGSRNDPGALGAPDGLHRLGDRVRRLPAQAGQELIGRGSSSARQYVGRGGTEAMRGHERAERSP
ncbi:phage holin family protein [Sinomonas atrocyanea]